MPRRGNCSLNHNQPNSTIYCSKCQRDICIDCHLFEYLDDLNHKEAIKEIMNLLVPTNPKTDNFHHSGFYPYTDIFHKTKSNRIINPKLIYLTRKRNNLLKVINISTQKGTAEFALKQILPIKDHSISKKVMDKAKIENNFMKEYESDFCILSYNEGTNSQAFEILMENWGKSLDKINFYELDQDVFLNVLRECSQALTEFSLNGLYHGDIKNQNIIFNERCLIPKFIDFGESTQLTLEELIKIRKTRGKYNKDMKHQKGYTAMFASFELLQYLNKSENTGDLVYSYGQMDVFSLGMTFLLMIINRRKIVDFHLLTELRSSSKRSGDFILIIGHIMDELLPELSFWNKEFNRKLFEVIKSCLQISIELRPNAIQLFAIFQYFQHTTLPQLKNILSNINNSYTIKKLIINYDLYHKLTNQATQPKENQKIEDTLELCKEYEKQLRNIYGNKHYKNTLQFLYLCEFYVDILDNMGDPRRKLEWLKKGLTIAEQILDSNKNHPIFSTLYNNIGAVMGNLRLFKDAEEMYLRSISHKREIHGNKVHKDIAYNYLNLGILYQELNDFRKAEESYKEVEYQYEEIYGEEPSSDVATFYSNLGILYQDKADYTKAEELFTRSLSMRIQLSDNKPTLDIADCYINLGVLYSYQGKYNKARIMYEKALEIRLKYYGETAHPNVANCYNNLGVNYKNTGYLELAEKMYLKALKQREEIYGNNPHPDCANSYQNLGVLYKEQHNYLKAEEMYDSAINQNIKIYGENTPHLHIAHCYHNFGALYFDMNYLNTAELVYLKALELKFKIFEDDEPHPDVASTRNNLGAIYLKQGIYGRAIQQFEECLLIMRKVHNGNETHPQIIVYNNNLNIARTNAQLELFREGREINSFNIFRNNCRSFGYLNPETQLSLVYFNDHMNSINLCIFLKYLLSIPYFYLDQEEKTHLFRQIPGKYTYYILDNQQFVYLLYIYYRIEQRI